MTDRDKLSTNRNDQCWCAECEDVRLAPLPFLDQLTAGASSSALTAAISAVQRRTSTTGPARTRTNLISQEEDEP